MQADEALKQEELRANLFMGAYFATKTQKTEATVPHTEDLDRLRMEMSQRPGVESLVTKLADQHTFLHWHLAFAEIMQCGGFDVVLGNPPWERIKLQEKEYFAWRSPEIAGAPNKAARNRLIMKLLSPGATPAEKASPFEIPDCEAGIRSSKPNDQNSR